MDYLYRRTGNRFRPREDTLGTTEESKFGELVEEESEFSLTATEKSKFVALVEEESEFALTATEESEFRELVEEEEELSLAAVWTSNGIIFCKGLLI